MTTVELEKMDILSMLNIDTEDYTEEELEAIIAIGRIAYNLQEMVKLNETID